MRRNKLEIIALSIIFSLGGCGKQQTATEEDVFVPVAQNDWAGGFSRLAKVQGDVMNIVSILDTHNYEIIQGNPTDYWDEDEYYYLYFIPMDSEILPLTMYINEIEGFDVVQANTVAYAETLGMQNTTLTRVKKDEYILDYQGTFKNRDTQMGYPGHRTVNCIYDAAHNWMQMVSNSVNVTTLEQGEDAFYEFAELRKGKYAFQNEKERMYVEYTDDGSVKSFFYTRLPDVPQVIEDASDALKTEIGIPEKEEGEELNTQPKEIETYGYFYLSNVNSLFKHIDDINADWTKAAGEQKTEIIYENNVLSVKLQNKLTGKTEEFSVTVTKTEGESLDEAIQELSD